MGIDTTVRITFSCPDNLRKRLTAQSDKEGIPRSQLIVEILENALGADTNIADARTPAVNRLLFDIQKRLSTLEGWRREIHDWTEKSVVNTDNLEQTVAEILNSQLTHTTEKSTKKGKTKIPSPKR